jgi:hypothetical protein
MMNEAEPSYDRSSKVQQLGFKQLEEEKEGEEK